MSDNQIPRATMTNFIRERIKEKRKISAQFIQTMLDLSKEFIDRVGAHSNQICQREGKKTINTDHLYRALEELKMEKIVPELKATEEQLKKKAQHKQQIKQKVQENIQKMNKEHSMKEKEEEDRPKIQVGNELRPIQLEEEEDFGAYIIEDEA